MVDGARWLRFRPRLRRRKRRHRIQGFEAFLALAHPLLGGGQPIGLGPIRPDTKDSERRVVYKAGERSASAETSS